MYKRQLKLYESQAHIINEILSIKTEKEFQDFLNDEGWFDAEYVNVFFKILFLDMVPLASASIKRILIGICRFELFRLVMACDT